MDCQKEQKKPELPRGNFEFFCY